MNGEELQAFIARTLREMPEPPTEAIYNKPFRLLGDLTKQYLNNAAKLLTHHVQGSASPTYLDGSKPGDFVTTKVNPPVVVTRLQPKPEGVVPLGQVLVTALRSSTTVTLDIVRAWDEMSEPEREGFQEIAEDVLASTHPLPHFQDPAPADGVDVAMVNHPKHYNAHPSGVETIEFIEPLRGNLFNAIKYAARAGHKGSETVMSDLRKSQWYLKREKDRNTAPELTRFAYILGRVVAHEAIELDAKGDVVGGGLLGKMLHEIVIALPTMFGEGAEETDSQIAMALLEHVEEEIRKLGGKALDERFDQRTRSELTVDVAEFMKP
jgi:hypothetical protein